MRRQPLGETLPRNLSLVILNAGRRVDDDDDRDRFFAAVASYIRNDPHERFDVAAAIDHGLRTVGVVPYWQRQPSDDDDEQRIARRGRRR
jgi:hypothetical protein